MRSRFLLFFLLLISVLGLYAQGEIRIGDTIVCNFQSGPKINSTWIKNDQSRKFSEGKTSSQNQIFDVKYSNFPPEAEEAFAFAVSIWESLVKSPVKIRVFANWTVLQNINTLGFVVPTETKNFANAPSRDLWYPMSLAEKIAGQDLNPIEEADIVATFNAGRTDWYFGIDGNCPSDKFDFVTIVLHELGHGLGVSGTLRVSSNNGFYGLSDGNPKIYDNYIINAFGEKLTDKTKFTNGTFELAQQITSNSLVFKSEIAASLNQSNGGAFPRLYAPSPYSGGSSISHLDEGTYNNTINSLMTPFASRGEVQHQAGPLIKGMFYDMGWLHTYIDHDPIGDIEGVSEIRFEANITSDTLLNLDKIRLHYKVDNSPVFFVSTLNNMEADLFYVSISDIPYESTVNYFFTVEDMLGRDYRFPIDPQQTLQFFFGDDVKPPVLTHQPVNQIVIFQNTLTLDVLATDNLGIKRVYLEVQSGENDPIFEDFYSIGDDRYGVSFDLSLIDLAEPFKYKIYVEDISLNTNLSTFPSIGYQSVSLNTFNPVGIYVNNFNSAVNDFYGDFSIRGLPGFSSPAIHSEHPYPKGQDNIRRELIYYLLTPLIIERDESFLEFREVVLVEPGDDNDFIVVEATRENGLWQEVSSRYDSRKHTDWLQRYNSNIRDGDSRAAGDLNLYKSNKIDLGEFFDIGDEIYVRFVLSSDQQNTGWGWAIDDLKFQDVQVGLTEYRYNNAFEVYPNPFNSWLEISNRISIRLVITDLVGRVIYDDSIEPGRQRINSEDWPSGIYIFKAKSLNGETVIKLLKNSN